MKPHIQRVFGGEILGTYWVCRTTIMSPIHGLGSTPKEAYDEWSRKSWMAAKMDFSWSAIRF